MWSVLIIGHGFKKLKVYLDYLGSYKQGKKFKNYCLVTLAKKLRDK